MKRLILVSHLAIGVVAAGLAACPPPIDGCTVGATRCVGASAQVCDSDTRWSEVMNCQDVAAQSGGQWACGVYDNGGHACLPVGDAAVDAGADADGGAR